VATDGDRRLALVTDVGHVTAHLVRSVARSHALLIECNHEPELLAAGPYPPSLKARVGGHYGHLSNAQAGALVARVRWTGLRHVIGMHLSERNNTPLLAARSLAGALGCRPDEVELAAQDAPMPWRRV